MKIKFYGTRGSIPVSDPGFMEFGGNTTCLFISGIDEGAGAIIMDAGTGIRNLGKDIMAGKIEAGDEISLGFTHFHWDHIQGFPSLNQHIILILKSISQQQAKEKL